MHMSEVTHGDYSFLEEEKRQAEVGIGRVTQGQAIRS
jgi:hypothetical protein